MQTITSKPKYWRTKTSLKSIDINVKEWFDKTYGNSYFSAQVTINGKYVVLLPFQYGYGDHAIDMVAKELIKLGVTDKNMHHYQEQQTIEFWYDKQEGCLKRDVKAFGEGY